MTALSRRLTRIWRSRVASLSIRAGTAGSTRQPIASPLRAAWAASRPTASSTHWRRANGNASMTSFPASIFEKSRMSFNKASSDSPLLRIVPTYSRCSGVSREPARTLVMPMTAFMGVRISWLMLARNSVLNRLARSASSLALRAAFSDSSSSSTVSARRRALSRDSDSEMARLSVRSRTRFSSRRLRPFKTTIRQRTPPPIRRLAATA